MRFNFKKISAIAISTLMTGMTMGVAAAANYPTPFVSGGVASGTAIVYGTGSGVSALDQQYAGNIQTNLQTYITSSGSSSTTIEGGDSVIFEKTSTKFQVGKSLLDVRSTAVDDSDMDTLLADGVFTDDDNDEFDYKQDIDMANITLTQFDDDDYMTDTPTIGVKITDGSAVLNYTLDFTEEPYFVDLETATLPLMNKEYYILDMALTTNNTITLLDSAEEATISEGETQTVTVGDKSYEVSLSYVGSTEAKFTVNGATTNSLSEAETQKLADGAYIGVKDIMYSSKDTGVSKVEFSIGKGKLVIEDSEEVQLNEEDIDNLYGYIGNNSAGDKITNIILQWKADDDLFVTETSSPTLPGFETVKLAFGGMTYPAEQTIIVKADGDDNVVLADFPIKNTVETIPLLYSNGSNFSYIGKDDNNRLATEIQDYNMTFTIGTDDYFVLSYKSGDDSESYLVRATGLDDLTNADTDNTVDFEFNSDGTWTSLETNVEQGGSVAKGSAEFTVGDVNNESEKTITLWVTGNNYLDRIYSTEGLEVLLPWVNDSYTLTVDGGAALACADLPTQTLGSGQLGYSILLKNTTPVATNYTCYYQPDNYKLVFNEEDKDGNLGSQGDAGWVNVSIGLDTDDEVYISSVSNGDINSNTAISPAEIGDTDVYVDYVQSALATKIEDDQGGDHEKVTITYHGGESYGKVILSDISASITSTPTEGGTNGAVMVTDAEVSSVSSKNLIIVGGSCINSAAAKVLGFSGPTCGAAFTASTGVGSGQFLIKSVSGAYTSGKIALVVAGYEAADTVNAVQYLINKKPDTSKTYKGTSATIAEEVVTTA